MTLMIASDIHGSAKYCAMLLEAYVREHADRLLLLGDILYHGPRNPRRCYDPKKVIEMLNGIKDDIVCVRGNCDSEVDGMVLDFPITAEAVMLFAGEGPDKEKLVKKLQEEGVSDNVIFEGYRANL